MYVMTNQAYIPKFSVYSAVKTGIQTPQLDGKKLKKFIYSNITIDGPAFILSHKEFGIGFFTRARFILDIRNVPYQITNILLQQNPVPTIPNEIDIKLRNVKISSMTWVEYGANFGKMIRKRGKEIIVLGGNLRYLTGVNVTYANLEKLKVHVDYTSLDVELKGKARFNEPAWNAGKGLGLDAGITYKRMLEPVDSYYANSKKSNCTPIDYRYKIGLSLIDLGTIRYKGNTYKGDIAGEGHIADYTKANSLNDLVKYNLQASVRTTPIWASLPTALSTQLDWNFDHHFFLATTIIQSVTTSRTVGVQRSNLWSLTPRYAFKNFEVAAPVTFERYIYPQFGLAFRIRSFVLGFDNACPLFFKKKTYGLNVYFGLGITLFKNPACRTRKHKPPTPGKTDGENILGTGKADGKIKDDKSKAVECPENLLMPDEKKSKAKKFSDRFKRK